MTELAKVYGDALYALAQEEGLEDALREELSAVCALLADDPAYVRLMNARSVPKAERLALLDEAFSGRVNGFLLNFMKLLCERGAFDQLSGCRDRFGAAYDEAHGILPATAVTASPMSEAQRERLIAALQKRTGKTIRLTERVDASLGGGVRLHMQGKTYDNTVASRMARLRRALSAQS